MWCDSWELYGFPQVHQGFAQNTTIQDNVKEGPRKNYVVLFTDRAKKEEVQELATHTQYQTRERLLYFYGEAPYIISSRDNGDLGMLPRKSATGL